MKHLLLATIAAFVLERFRTSVDVQDINDSASLDWAVVPTTENQTETADLLRKHVGKTSDELKAAAN